MLVFPSPSLSAINFVVLRSMKLRHRVGGGEPLLHVCNYRDGFLGPFIIFEVVQGTVKTILS